MELFAFGINHTAPLSLREQVVFNAETMVQALRDLVDHNKRLENHPIALETQFARICRKFPVACRPSSRDRP